MLTILVLGQGCARPEVAAREPIQPRAGWMGIYLGEQKLGYSSYATQPITQADQPAIETRATVYTNLAMLGVPMTQDIVIVQICDLDYAPKELTLTQESGGRRSSTVAKFEPGRIVCQVISEQDTTEKIVPIPEGVTLVADENALLGKEHFEPGDKVEFHVFNPLTFTIDKMSLAVKGREKLEVAGQTYDALAAELIMPIMGMVIPANVWMDQEGEMLKMTVPTLMNMSYVKEPQDRAMQMPQGGSKLVDLAQATAICPDRPIPNPRACRLLRLKVTGLEDWPDVPTDARQQIEAGPEGTTLWTLRAWEFPADQSLPLPLNQPDYQEFLQSSPYVQADHKDIIAQAKEIVGEEKNAYRAAAKISQWVHGRIQVQFDIGVFRSALDILHDPAGVCRDAAVLYAGLARAAGIPTRICAGLVYLESRNRFLGHAWAESFVGEWVPFDPTTPTDFVDATHLKLAQGEYTAMFKVLKALGNMKVQVLEQQ